MKLPVRRINTTNEWRLVQRHGDTRQLHKGWRGISKRFPVNWITGVEGSTSWLKRPEFYCSRRDLYFVFNITTTENPALQRLDIGNG
ncbi:hypothetical protein TNCV_4626261 [Trichonephila clavipes]|nr:hypothetical protein TNCV_4626261 [Trichonephila clavipes]